MSSRIKTVNYLVYSQPKSMKTINTLTLAVLITFLISACSSSKMVFETSSIVPAATGSVQVKQDKNKNYIISVETLNLAEPQKLDPARESYLVWMESTGNPVRKLGQISTSSGTFSKALKGGVNATATVEPSRIFITAENDISIAYPEGKVILTTGRK